MIESRPNDKRNFVHKKLLGGLTGAVGAVISGGNPLTGAVSGFARGGRQPAAPRITRQPNRVTMNTRVGPFGAFGSRTTVSEFGGARPVSRSMTNQERAEAGMPPKRRRMNPGNAKALRRALRRTDAFVNLAKRSLKGTGFKIVRSGSTRPRGPRTIVESGPGSVVTR